MAKNTAWVVFTLYGVLHMGLALPSRLVVPAIASESVNILQSTNLTTLYRVINQLTKGTKLLHKINFTLYIPHSFLHNQN